jgi:hypothetical protein
MKFDSFQDQLIPMLGDSQLFFKIIIRVNSYKILGELTQFLNYFFKKKIVYPSTGSN